MRHWSKIASKLTWATAAMVSATGLVVGCSTEDSAPTVDNGRYPTDEMADHPEREAEAVTLAALQSCLAAPGQAGNITAVAQFGGAIQAGTSTALPCQPGVAGQCSFPTGDCYFVVSGGDAPNWSTASSVAVGGACVADPVFGQLCDKGGATVSVFVPVGSTKITFDYRFFEWDYVPFEDPFAVTLYNPANQPVASTGSQNSCEFSAKSGSALAIGNQRTVEFNVAAYQGQTVKLEFRASDRSDQVLDAGALVNNLQVVAGAMSCNGVVCGGCASAANCAAVDADGDGVNSCTDCNDNNANVKPGKPEVCNGQDDNCSGVADEGGVCCVDNDSDGYTGCNGDCNDNDAAVKPGALEICDGQDNDCNGLIDFIGNQPVCAPPDDDGDGVNQNDDCNDGDATVYPGATEICDFKDNDCDGTTDEGTCSVGCVTITNGVNGGVTADAAIYGDYPTTPDFNQNAGYSGVSSGGNENFVLLHFSLAPIEAQAGTQNVNVTSAALNVYVPWNPYYNQVAIHGCNAPWSESTVTFANYPMTNCDSNSLSSFNAGGVGYRAANVTDLVDSWLNGTRPNHGMVLREAPINYHGYWFKGSSVNLQPKLEVCYFLSTVPPGEVGGN